MGTVRVSRYENFLQLEEEGCIRVYLNSEHTGLKYARKKKDSHTFEGLQGFRVSLISLIVSTVSSRSWHCSTCGGFGLRTLPFRFPIFGPRFELSYSLEKAKLILNVVRTVDQTTTVSKSCYLSSKPLFFASTEKIDPYLRNIFQINPLNRVTFKSNRFKKHPPTSIVQKTVRHLPPRP